MFNRIQHTVLTVIAPLLGLGLMGLAQLCQAAPFYAGPLWDAHSHVDEGTTITNASKIAAAINVAPAGTLIEDGTTGTYVLPQDLPGVRRILLFPKNCLDNYMQNNLVTAPLLQHRLITGIGFQNSPSDLRCVNGVWKPYLPSTPGVYDPAEDVFLNYVEIRAEGGSYQWLGEVSLYGKEGDVADIKADLFDPVIEARILRVLDIAANSGMPVTIHHTVTDSAGNPIDDLTGSATDTAAERFLSILQTHVDNAAGQPASVVWTHWGGLSTPQAIQGMINQFHNLYFDLAWFNKGLTEYQPIGVVNPLLNPDCNIVNLLLCVFTPEWESVISSNAGRFLAGMDAGKNSEFDADYRVRELILRTVLGTLAAADAELIAANNLKQLLGVLSAPADGDITLDGAVDVTDILLGQQVLGGSATLPPLQFKHGDVAPLVGGLPVPDDLFTLGDLLVIQRKALGQVSF